MLPPAAATRSGDRGGVWRPSRFRARRKWLLAAALSAVVTLISVVAIVRRSVRGDANEVRAAACAAKARTNFAEGDVRDALHWAELAVALDPTSTDAQRLAGGARAALGDLSRALDRLEAAAHAAPDDAEAALSAGLAARVLARHAAGAADPSVHGVAGSPTESAQTARSWLLRALERADAAAARHADLAAPRFVGAAACLALQDPAGALARLDGLRPASASEVEQAGLLRAAAEVAAGRPDAALRIVEGALGDRPSPAAASARARLVERCVALRGTIRERGLRCLAAAQPDDAAALLSEWVRENRGDAVGLAALASALVAAGRGAEIEQVRTGLRTDGGPRGDDAAVWFSAHVRRAAGDPRGAIECLELLRARDPANCGVLAALIACAAEARDPAVGVAAAEASWREVPRREAPRQSGIAALVGIAREHVGDVDGAILAYRAALGDRRGGVTDEHDRPTEARNAHGSGSAMADRGGGGVRRASIGARLAADCLAADCLAADRLADLLLRIGRADDALATLDAAGPAEGAPVPSLRRGRALLATGRIAEAEAEFRAVAAEDTACAAAHVGVAQSAWLRGDAIAARSSLDSALDADPESVDAWTTLFATARDPDAPVPLDARLAAAIVARPRSAALPFVAGVIAERRGDFDRAASHYRASLAIAPRSVAARNNLAWVLATALGRPSEARRLADDAVADAPTSPQVLDTAGWARFLDGDAGGAEPLLARARRGAPASGAVALRHSRALAAIGRTREARDAIDAAVAAEPAVRGSPEYDTALAAASFVPALALPNPSPVPSESEAPR